MLPVFQIANWSFLFWSTHYDNDIAARCPRHFWWSADWSLSAWIHRGLPLIIPLNICKLIWIISSSRRRSILKILTRKTLFQHHQAVTSKTQPHRRKGWKSCLASIQGISQSATSQVPQGLPKSVLRGLISRVGFLTSPHHCALGVPIRWCLKAETGSWEAVGSGLGLGERLELAKRRRTICTWGAGGAQGPGPPLTSCRLCACSSQQIFHLPCHMSRVFVLVSTSRFWYIVCPLVFHSADIYPPSTLFKWIPIVKQYILEMKSIGQWNKVSYRN